MLYFKNYDSNYVKSVLITYKRIREELASSRIELIKELEEQYAKYELIASVSAISISEMPISATNSISDPTFNKVLELDSELIDEHIESINHMLTTNAEIENRVKRIVYIYLKTCEFLPLHYYVTNLAWYDDNVMKQDDIARNIRRAKSVVKDILNEEADVICLLANSEYNTNEISHMPAERLIKYIVDKDLSLHEKIMQNERGGISK